MPEPEGGTAAEFGSRLLAAMVEFGPLCVGIDPHRELLAAWGLDDSANGVREFGLRTVAAAAGRVGTVKPQVAFFERHGAAGYAALEAVLAEARSRELLVIADVKRGEIGSSMRGYADAWLTPGAPLEADAITVNPYLGVGALEPAVTAAIGAGKGLFVLASTSNPEGRELQSAVAGARPLAELVMSEVAGLNTSALAQGSGGGLGSIGVVVGATVELSPGAVDLLASTPILCPGFGAQGAEYADVRRVAPGIENNVLMSSSRAVLGFGPTQLAGAISRHAAAARAALGAPA